MRLREARQKKRRLAMASSPTKLVLINAGCYDYAEVELVGALQIVGPNNTGKTTLINTLQLLYIDNWRQMDFGSFRLEQTHGYYFRDQYSYVLFECLSGSGYSVVGWRGQSPASGAMPERFFYSGRYRMEDFYDEASDVREPRAISARLAQRSYRPVPESAQWQKLLLPATAAENSGLGLVALQDRETYPQFRETLKNLLTLSTITQAQMRDRLLMLAELSPDLVALDAQSLFGREYQQLKDQRTELDKFQQRAAEVRELLQQWFDRQTARGEMLFRWNDLSVRRDRFIETHQTQISTLQTELSEEKKIETDLIGKISTKQEEHKEAERLVGGLRHRMEELKRQEQEFKNFPEALERSAVVRLGEEVRARRQSLKQAATMTIEQVERQIAQTGQTLRQVEADAENFGRWTITLLRKTFSDNELRSLFSVLEYHLLTAPIGTDGVQIHDQNALETALRELLARVDGDIYHDDAVTVRMRPDARELPENADDLRAEAEDLRRRWETLGKTAEAIRESDRLTHELEEKEKDLHTRQRRLFAFEEWREATKQELQLRADLAKQEKVASAIEAERVQMQERKDASGEKQRTLSGKCSQAAGQFDAVMGKYRECQPAIFNVSVIRTTDIAEDFHPAVAQYFRLQQRENEATRKVDDGLRGMEVAFGTRYVGSDEADTMRRLREELDALVDHQTALSRAWLNLLRGTKATCHDVLKRFEDVKAAATRLNREFGRVQISNLRAIRIEPVPQSDFMEWFKTVTRLNEPELWDEHSTVDATLDRFRSFLGQHSIIRFSSLFVLRFDVTGPDGQKRHYQDFSQIESHGTTITLKVLFSLLVLQSLLRKGECTVPFFLDEIQALDEDNRRAILTTARQLGFIAITAAPDSVAEVDTAWFLQTQDDGRVILVPQQSYSIDRLSLSAEPVK